MNHFHHLRRVGAFLSGAVIVSSCIDFAAFSKETGADHIERIYNITQKYPNQLICQPNYEGASVTI